MYLRIYGWMLQRFVHEQPLSLERYAPLQALPIFLLLLAVGVAYGATQYVFSRKEIQ
jgi:hypothetical protein